MPPQPSQPQGDNSLGPFWIIVGIFAVGWGIWYFAHAQIALVVLKIKFYEALLINWFSPTAAQALQTIKSVDPATASFQVLADVSQEVGQGLRLPVAIVIAVLAGIIYFSSIGLKFKKIYNMQRLAEDQRATWPHITPVLNLDLVNTDIDEGPWAMALSPMQFAKKYKLLQEERTVSSEGPAPARTRITVTVRRDEAYKVFALQIGRYWTGIEHLNRHTKALFAVCAARANRDRDGAEKLLRQISASAVSGKLDFSGTEELLAKHKDQKVVQRVINSHAFIMTVMASMLVLARTDGVLASAEFLWLKPVDRPLWFMLNAIGRQTPFTEVAGPFAHWLAERNLGRKLSVPMVEEAVNALEIAIKDIIYIPDEE